MSSMFDIFSNPREKFYFWIGLGIGLLAIAILRTYLG
jgi:hypothetical protein